MPLISAHGEPRPVTVRLFLDGDRTRTSQLASAQAGHTARRGPIVRRGTYRLLE